MPRQAGGLLLVAWLTGCAWMTWRQLPVWHDNVTLWTQAVTVAPRQPNGWLNLGFAYIVAERAPWPDAEHAYLQGHALALLRPDLDLSTRHLLLVTFDDNLTQIALSKGDWQTANTWQLEAAHYRTSGR